MGFDIAQLKYEIDSRQTKTAAKDLDKMDKSATKADKSATKLGRSSKSASGGLGSFTRAGMDAAAANEGFSRSNTKAGRSLSFLKAGLIGLAAAVVGVGIAITKLSISMALDLNKAITEVATLSQNAYENMGRLERSARSLAREFGGNATSQVKAFYQAVSAGAGTIRQSGILLREANKLATAGVTDIVTSVDILTTAVNAYSKSGLKASEASDAIFTGVKLGKTTVAELARSLGDVIPIAATLGISFDELVAATAALTTQGLTTSQATTGLKGILLALIKPTDEARKFTEKLGIQFNAAGLKGKTLRDLMKDLITVTGGSSAAMGAIITESNGLSAALSFANGASAAFSKGAEDMTKKLGAVGKASDIVAAQLEKRHKIALAEISDSWLTLGKELMPDYVRALELVAPKFQTMTAKLARAIAKTKAEFNFLKDITIAAFSIIPSAIESAVLSAMQFMVKGIKNGVNLALTPINTLIKGINYIRGTNFSQIELSGGSNSFNTDIDAANARTQKGYEMLSEAAANHRKAQRAANRIGNDFGFMADDDITQAILKKSTAVKALTKAERDLEIAREKAAKLAEAALEALRAGSEGSKIKLSEYEKQRQAVAQAINGYQNETQALRDQQLALGMTDANAQAFLRTKQIIAQLTLSGKTITDAEIHAIRAQSAAYAQAAQSLHTSKAARDADNASIQNARDLTGGIISDLRSGLKEGESLWTSLGNAAINTIDKITDRLLDQLLDAIFQVNNAGSGSGGGMFGNLLANLFGGVGTPTNTIPSTSAVSTLLPAVYHKGTESVGSGSFQTRTVPASLFNNAPRFHNGLKSNELPAILEKGERVATKAQTAHEASVISRLTNVASLAGTTKTSNVSNITNIYINGAKGDLEVKRVVQEALAQATPSIVKGSVRAAQISFGNQKGRW